MRRNKGPRLRIIGGQWRSRQLPILDQPGLRPTPDRVRETLFNWLQHEIAGARCLDLFAGSGALGLEAASRGALEVVLVEQSPAACHQLQQNIVTLGGESTLRLVQADALDWLTGCAQSFDVVFLDPPYAADLLPEVCTRLEGSACLADEAWIYLEQPADQPLPELPVHWSLQRSKKAGQVGYHLLRRETGN